LVIPVCFFSGHRTAFLAPLLEACFVYGWDFGVLPVMSFNPLVVRQFSSLTWEESGM
jgi:hypothetical protein